MIIKISRLLLLLLLVFPAFLNAQTTTYPVEGVYTSFNSFRKGKPDLLKSDMVRSLTGANDFSIRQWINSENLFFLDNDSIRQKFDANDFWGYVENGTLYLALGYKFHKVTMLGQISYFLESYPVIKGNVAPVVTETRSAAIYRLLDMETGDLTEYDIPNLEELLSRDEKLFEQFKAIASPKAKKKKMYSFIEMYNKEHPLLPLTEL